MGDANLLRTDEHHRDGSGTLEHVKGSHLWPKTPPDRASFHAPEDCLAPVAAATPDGVEPERVPVVVKAGGAAFPAGPSTVRDRTRPPWSAAPCRVTAAAAILSLDESFFPVLWDDTGARSAWLAGLPQLP